MEFRFHSAEQLRSHYTATRLRLRGPVRRQILTATPALTIEVELAPASAQAIRSGDSYGVIPLCEQPEIYRVGFVVERFRRLPEPLARHQVILDAVTEAWAVDPVMMLGPSLMARHVWPRHICMTLWHRMIGMSFTDIGRRFNRDHTSVIYAVRKHAKRIDAMLASAGFVVEPPPRAPEDGTIQQSELIPA